MSLDGRRFPGFGGSLRGNDEAHAAAGHSPEHPEPPEILAEMGLALGMKLEGWAPPQEEEKPKEEIE